MEISEARKIVAKASELDLENFVNAVQQDYETRSTMIEGKFPVAMTGRDLRLATALATLVLHGRETGAFERWGRKGAGKRLALARALAGDTGEGADRG